MANGISPLPAPLMSCLARKSKTGFKPFDDRTFFYDIFLDDKLEHIIFIGPPKRNLPYINLRCRYGKIDIPVAKIINEGLMFMAFFKLDTPPSSEISVKILYGNYQTEYIKLAIPTPLIQKYKLAMTTLIKNENPNLVEWIEYYRILGCAHFYIYDNGTTNQVELIRILEKYISQGMITLIHWDFIYGPYKFHKDETLDRFCQVGQINHCIRKYGGRCNWLISADVDEYILPIREIARNNLITPLLRFVESQGNNVAALRLQMIWFGNRGKGERGDEKLHTKYYLYRAPAPEGFANRTKCIIRPGRIRYCGIHVPVRISGNGVIKNIYPNIMRINHYHCISSKKRVGDKYNKVFDNMICRLNSQISNQISIA